MKNDLNFDDKRLAQNIRQARVKSGLTQAEVAQKLGVRQQHVFEWENNHRGLNAKNLLMLHSIFGNDIFDGVVMTEYERNLEAIERKKTRHYTFDGGRISVSVTEKGITVYQGSGAFAFLGECNWSKKKEQMLLDGVNPVDEGWETKDGEKLAYVDMSSLI